ncbi:MAG: DUF6498-containing protein [Acidobacteriota bacterium]|nr:DUF6498-containing protein [Acidobacteriota bacterium]
MTRRKSKSTFKLIISEITALAINVIPLALWFFEDYPVETIVILYALESVLAMLFAVLCVLFLAPSEQRDEKICKTRFKKKVIGDFLWMFGFGTALVLFFPTTVIFLVKHGENVTLPAVIFGLKLVLAFQLFEFFSNLYLLRPLSLKQSEFLLASSFGGIAVMLVSVFLGFIAAAFGMVFLPFIVLKTIVDIGQPVQYFLGQTPSPTEPVFDYMTEKAR